MGDYEDLLERLREQEVDEDLVAGLEKFNAGALRKKAGERDEYAAKVDSLEKQLKRVEQAPKIEKAFRDAGVDFGQLRPAEQNLLKTLEVDGDPDQDFVSKVISENQLPLVAGSQQDPGTPPNAAAVADAAKKAGNAGSPSAVITPEMAEGWTQEATMRFYRQYPEESEALLRGDSVQVQFNP